MIPKQENYQKLSDDFFDDLKQLFRSEPDPQKPILRVIFIIGSLLCITSFGALAGFTFAYKKLKLKEKGIHPFLHDKPRIVYAAMIAGGILSIVVPFLIVMFSALFLDDFSETSVAVKAVISWLFVNFIVTGIFLGFFRTWQVSILNYLNELKRYGTARFATREETQPYRTHWGGLYIGDYHYYNEAGHVLTVAGTRGGKGVNLIIPNLLKTGMFEGSFVVVDPKGEIAAITANAQRRAGRKVVILNPWDLLGELVGSAQQYNPLDLLKMDLLNLSDDVQLIAETIVPSSSSGDEDHFNNRARSIIAGLLLHLVTTDTIQDNERHLGTLWHWLRLSSEDWDNLLISMAKNQNENAGDMVEAAALEILALMEKGEKEYTSVMSTAQKWTDFLKSPALRNSLKSTKDFKSSDLTDGNTTVYIIIPADRLKTHYQWLRLLVSSLMRSVVRNPNKDVCFLLDEFYALGYLSEIEVALGSYAGYGIHIWAILQNLVQLNDQYGNNWENFISSCAVKHFFNISDNFTAEYVSKMFGELSYPVYGAIGTETGVTARPLVNIDELRRLSSNTIFTIVDNLHPAQFAKVPYFTMPELQEGKDYDKNPYMIRKRFSTK